MGRELILAVQDQTNTSSPSLVSKPSTHLLQARWLAVAALLAVGLIVTLINLRWPAVRNALDYMKAAVEILAHHFKLTQVSNESVSTGGKPLLFSLLAAPFVWAFGGNTGIVAASAIGTGFFLLSTAYSLPRLNRASGIQGVDPTPAQLILTTLNPLVLCQFWSGYPDALFAGFVVLAFTLSDVVATETSRDTRWHIVGLGLTICAALHTKLYGAVLGLNCPLYVLLRTRAHFSGISFLKQKVATFCVVWLLLFLVVVAAILGFDPLVALGTTAGYADYMAALQGAALQWIESSVEMLLFSLVLVFHIALIFLLRRRAWAAWSAAPATFVLVYVAGLLPFSGTAINMRYFLPVFVFLTPYLISGALDIPRLLRRAITVCYVSIAMVLTLNFNVAAVEKLTHATTRNLSDRYPNLEDWLDNLRLPVQVALRRQIDTINNTVPSGGVLYWASDYYKTATHGLAHHLGVRNDIHVRYVLEPTDPPESTQPVFLTEFTSTEPPARIWRTPAWATATEYGNGLFRLDPLSVELLPMSGDHVSLGDSARWRARINSTQGLTIKDVKFFEGDNLLGRYREPPYEMSWWFPDTGRHEIVAQVEFVERTALRSTPIVVFSGVSALERSARNTDDLVTEYEDGMTQATQSVLYLDSGHHLIGIRFNNIAVPPEAGITEAHLKFTGVGTDTGPILLDIGGELSSNAVGLRLIDGDLSRRHRTRSHVPWELPHWVDGKTAASPNLGPVLEEILSQPDWRSGNSLMLLIRVSGHDRLAQAADKDGHGSPVLEIRLREH